jgi:glutamine cyclotransferase
VNYRFISIILLLSLATACETSSNDKKRANNAVVKSPIEIEFERGNSNFVFGDSVAIRVSLRDSNLALTNIEIHLNEDSLKSVSAFPFTLSVSTDGLLAGRNLIRVSASNKEVLQSKSVSFNLLPTKSPDTYIYRVNAVYDHDKDAYTQGLFYHNGMLFEGTGQRGQSSVRQVNLSDGKVLKRKGLEKKLFGEGIVYHNGSIYQLTWNSQVGIIYDANDLNELRRFYYTGEGWGLTSDSISLIRSDGSNKLYYHNPDDFRLIKTIEVYTEKGPLNKLNELEYINGKIYANIYQQNAIAIINPSNGVVEGMINLKGILLKKYQTDEEDVLNGIAYDAENNRLFVTGKYWSKLFEIELIKNEVH